MIQIMRMDSKHVEQIAELEKLCFSAPWSATSIRSELTNPLSLWLVAVCGEDVVGYVGSQTVMGEADMMNIAVLPTHRKQGIAQGLVEALIKALHEVGAYQLTLEVRASNAPAQALYSKMGFEQIGRRPNYYRAPKEDALILRKEWTL